MADNQNFSTQSTDEPKKSKKKWIILGGVVVLIGLIIFANVDSKRKAEEAKLAEDQAMQASEQAAQEETEAEEQLSDLELEQQALIEVFGDPPAGFRWNDDGEPVPISNENLTAEEVVYHYLRAVSILDMANAQKYANYSSLIEAYDSFYSDDAESYYSQFLRKMYSKALSSIEVLGTEREAIFANGRVIYTMNLNMLDLTYKDFWKEDSEEIFTTLRNYLSSEDDSVKAQQYVFDKIREYYDKPDAKKREIQVDLVLDKVSHGGWLITDDFDVDTACRYTDGTSVYEYLMECYSEWLDDTIEAEEEAAEEAERKAEEAMKAEEEAAREPEFVDD